MRSTSSILAGTIAASLLAGPLLLSFVTIGLVIRHPLELYGLGMPHVAFALLVLAASAPLGFFFAGPPVFFGAAAMSWLGWHVPESRSPFVWGAAGATLASIVAIPFILFLGSVPDDNPLPFLMAFSISGTVCALICRRMTSWPDEL